MAIKIGTNKTVVNGVRGREILSIKALRRNRLPVEYLLWDGAVYSKFCHTEQGKDICLHILRATSGIVYPTKVMVPHLFLKIGWWLSEEKFQAMRAGLIRAGNQLTEINKRQLKEWHGNEVVVISALGMVDTDTIKGFDEIEPLICANSHGAWGGIILRKLHKLAQSDGCVRVWLLTSKVCKGQRKYRVLKDTAVVECGGVTSVETCRTVSRLLMKILIANGLPDYVVTEQQFQKVVARLKRTIRNAESASWQGIELVRI